MWMHTPLWILKLHVFLSQYSPTYSTTMGDAPEPRTKSMHLTNLQIAKIFGLAKVNMSQQKMRSLMKCSASAIQHTLVTFLFETFNGPINIMNTNEKQQNVKIDMLYMLSNKMTPSHSVILPILLTIKLIFPFPWPPYNGNDQKWVWTVTLSLKSMDYQCKMLLKD